MDEIKWIEDGINKLYGAPVWLLVVCLSIVVGYLLKAWKRYPNNFIPHAVVTVSAITNTVLMMPMRQPKQPLGAYILTQLIVGCVVGFCAWTFHRFVLKRVESKFPWVQQAAQESGLDTASPFKSNSDLPNDAAQPKTGDTSRP